MEASIDEAPHESNFQPRRKVPPTFKRLPWRGTARVGWMFTLGAAAYNLVRLPKLPAATA